jgi:hypothetical protein
MTRSGRPVLTAFERAPRGNPGMARAARSFGMIEVR